MVFKLNERDYLSSPGLSTGTKILKNNRIFAVFSSLGTKVPIEFRNSTHQV